MAVDSKWMQHQLERPAWEAGRRHGMEGQRRCLLDQCANGEKSGRRWLPPLPPLPPVGWCSTNGPLLRRRLEAFLSLSLSPSYYFKC